jgi:ankyrin repeat protein
MAGDAANAHARVAAHPDVIARLTPEDRGMFAQAVWTGRADSVRLMAEVGFDLTWEATWGGTPLHHAAWLGKPDVVRLLLGLGAPVNVRDSQFGSSPIAWAAHGSANCRSADDEYCAIVDLLIDAGSDYATAVNKFSEPPESMASRRVAKRLEERGFIV